MADSTDGIDLMRRRMARAQRVPPAPRRPAGTAAAPPVAAEPAEPADAPAAVAPPQVHSPRPSRAAAGATRRPRVGADDPPVNLAIRVRRPLDDHLVDLLHALRKTGIRSSKVELIEMLLWELPAEAEPVRRRLAEFRKAAPRGGDGA